MFELLKCLLLLDYTSLTTTLLMQQMVLRGNQQGHHHDISPPLSNTTVERCDLSNPVKPTRIAYK